MEAKHYLAISAGLIILVVRWWNRAPSNKSLWKILWKSRKLALDFLLAFIIGLMTFLLLESVEVQASFKIDINDLKESSRFLLGVLALILTLVITVATMTIKMARDAVDDLRRIGEDWEKRTDERYEALKNRLDDMARDAVDNLRRIGEGWEKRTDEQYKVLQNRLDESDKKTERADKQYIQQGFIVQRMRLHLDALDHQIDATKKFEAGDRASFSDMGHWEDLASFYGAIGKAKLQSKLKKLKSCPQAHAKITDDGWEYISLLEKNHKGKQEEIAKAARELLDLRKT